VLTPPLKWAGGKRWLAPRLAEFYAPHSARRLTEPFVGGMGVALSLRPAVALLNDINQHAIDFYQCLQRGLVIERPMLNERDAYYQARAEFNALVKVGQGASDKAAGLFYYLNRTCYNGLCRFNRSDEFNVPFGRYKAINYQTDFRAYAPVLGAWTFTCMDFEQLDLPSNDFVYADPPYDV
jgi:DNA adenine methylase